MLCIMSYHWVCRDMFCLWHGKICALNFDDVFYFLPYYDVFLFDYLCCIVIAAVYKIYKVVDFQVGERLREHYSVLSQWHIDNMYIFAVLFLTMMHPIYIYDGEYASLSFAIFLWFLKRWDGNCDVLENVLGAGASWILITIVICLLLESEN